MEAEAAYVRAQGFLASNDPDRPAIEERIAASIYKQAEAKKTAGDAVGAVDDFLRISQVAGTSKIAAQAEYDAGASLINLKEWPRAIQVLEHFRSNNPKSEFTADVTKKLAVAYGETGQAGHLRRPETGRVDHDRGADPLSSRGHSGYTAVLARDSDDLGALLDGDTEAARSLGVAARNRHWISVAGVRLV